MKRINFTLEGVTVVDDKVTPEQVKKALARYAGMTDLLEDNPVDLGFSSVPKGISYTSVKVSERGGEMIRYEMNGTPATELASKLLSAVSECGDHIVINSLTMPCPAGDSFGYVVYHKGDDYFELE